MSMDQPITLDQQAAAAAVLPCDSGTPLQAEAFEPTYNEAFPPLFSSEQPQRDLKEQQQLGKWSQKMALRTSIITQVFHVPVEERKYKDMNEQQFGGSDQRTCADVMQETGTNIEMSLAKDQSLTIVITGKQDAVTKARRRLVQLLQTQITHTISIPKEHHRFLLGKGGKLIQKLQEETNTKITLPAAHTNADEIRITGTKEGIDKACHEIQIMSDEQAKLGFERLHIPYIYHPFIQGPNNETQLKLMETYGVRINVPPANMQKDELTVAGEKDGVIAAVDIINKIYDEKKRRCQTVSVEVRKSQHKYVIGTRGTNLSEIMAATGVSVEMPPLDSHLETITLRGEQDKLGPALTLVYAKANSVVNDTVNAPSWLHKFIIGKKGANIRQLTQDLPKVHIEFTDGQDLINLEGPPDDVRSARGSLEELIHELKSRLSFEDIVIDQKYHRHIIGKNGANVNRLKEAHGVIVRIPSDNEHSNVVRLEGSPQGVAEAKKEIMEMVGKMENEKVRDILIEQRFHKTIIGTKGEKIKDIREKFNNVMIMLPDPGKKTDVVTLRGPKQDVDKVYRYLQQLHQELIAQNYRVDVPIYKQFHKNIIGKGGATIRKIREDTNTKIDLPTESSESDIIVITGRREDAEKALDMIQSIQNELANIVTQDISIPSKLHNSIIGAKGRLIRSIMDECGGVNIKFPPEGSGSEKVTIRGPKEDVDKAKKQLQELTAEKQIASFSAEIRAKPDHHRFLIGRGGANIRKLRDNTGARVIFPNANDEDQELITIIGTKEAVAKAKAELEATIKNLENIMELKIHIDPKYHRHFVARQGQVLREIGEEYGGVLVSFPRVGSTIEEVSLKGAKDCVEGAKKRILEIVAELESMVTVDCVIAQKHHRTVMGARGLKVQGICSQFGVQIKFPDRRKDGDEENEEPEQPTVNGDAASQGSSEGGEDAPRACDIIRITGQKDKAEAAKNALLDLIPVTAEVPVPFDYHRFIIGNKGTKVRELMERYDVNITIPPKTQNTCDFIKVVGASANVADAKLALEERVKELEKEQEDRKLRSFLVEVHVDPVYHPKIIGRKGAVITKIRKDHDVDIQLPEKGREGNDNMDLIKIIGYQEKAEAARNAIQKIVADLESLHSETVTVDNRIHSRLIGSRGKGIREIMNTYKVDIKFPSPKDADPDAVVITGAEDDVFEAKDHLLNLEEEYLQDREWREQMTVPSSTREETNNLFPASENRGFMVRDAPWEHTNGASTAAAPDHTSTEDFPSMGAAVTAPQPNMAWGRGRRVSP